MFAHFSAGTNLNVYNNRMRTVIEDKAFFLDHVEFDVLVDYGCADGSLIKYVSAQRPNAEYIGFDISKEEIELAKKDSPYYFYSDWASVECELRLVPRGKKVLMVCNSLIHEIYAYDENIEEFWGRVTSPLIDTIAIRDMYYNGGDAKVSEYDLALMRNSKYAKLFSDFEDKYGMQTYKELTHFILKYRYDDNWDRELNENYFSDWLGDLCDRITNRFKLTYYKPFIPEFIKETAFKDLGYDMIDATHLKIILERK